MNENVNAMFDEVYEQENNRCERCEGFLITTPDGTTCCPFCGLVIGPGYSSWFSSPALHIIDEEEYPGWDGTIDNAEMLLDKLGV